MNGYKIALLAWFAMGSLRLVCRIGKPVKPVTPEAAAAAIVILGTLAALVVLS